ncbi:MAG: hypothetical protein ACREP1_11710, partial [Rhodanobacteraceae bacterium]
MRDASGIVRACERPKQDAKGEVAWREMDFELSNRRYRLKGITSRNVQNGGGPASVTPAPESIDTVASFRT